MQPGRDGTPRLLVPTLFAAVVLFVAVLLTTNAATAPYPWINHDAGYHAYIGLEMLEGSRLYVDLKEDNPPGSPLLLGWIAHVGGLLGLPGFLAQHLFVLAVGLAGLAVLSVALPRDGDDLRFALVALAYLLVLVRGTFSNNLYPGAPDIPYDFGQREHLFSLLFLPYLCLRLFRRGTPRACYPFLVLLGFVSMFKPFWPPLIVIVELYRQFDRRTGRWSVPLLLGGGMLLPFAFLGLHSTDSLLRFFGENIPMYLRGAYTHYDTSYADFARSPLHRQIVAGAALLVLAGFVCLRQRALQRRQVGLLWAIPLLAYLSIVHQHKFWSYHTMVYFGTVVLSAVLLLAAATHAIRRTGLRRVTAIGLALVLLAAVGLSVRGTARMLRDYPPLGYQLASLIEPHERIMYFSMSVTTSYAPLLLRKPMVGPWTVFLDLPELLAMPRGPERTAVLRDYAAEVREVIDAERPALLVFSPETQAMPPGVTLHDFFSEQGVVPHPSYRRLESSALARFHRQLTGWPVYARTRER